VPEALRIMFKFNHEIRKLSRKFWPIELYDYTFWPIV